MTFEDTDTRAPATDAEDGGTAPRRGRRMTLPRETSLDKMMRFIANTEMIAGNIRGLAVLFKVTFIECAENLPDNQSYAADIVEECLQSIARRLDDNAEAARQAQRHLEREGAR